MLSPVSYCLFCITVFSATYSLPVQLLQDFFSLFSNLCICEYSIGDYFSLSPCLNVGHTDVMLRVCRRHIFRRHETQWGLVVYSYVARQVKFFSLYGEHILNRGNAEDGTCGEIDCFEEIPRLDQT